jgi:hypothetical protein
MALSRRVDSRRVIFLRLKSSFDAAEVTGSVVLPTLIDDKLHLFVTEQLVRGWLSYQFANFSSGVNVMITIFGDFCPFLAKILAFFFKTIVIIQFLQKFAVF